jgi:hypothetical protein
MPRWIHMLTLLTFAGLPTVSLAQDDARWTEALKKFKTFGDEQVKAAEARNKQPLIRMVEFKSELVSEAFPEHRFFVLDAAHDGSSLLFALHQSGKISDLGDCTWRGDIPSKSFQVAPVLDFIRTAKIKVIDEKSALRAARIVEEIQGAPTYVGFLRINTKDFTVFDRRFIERHYGPSKDWEYHAEKRPGGWLVERKYVGPPAMIQRPPVYEIDVSEKQELLDARQRD